MNQPRALVADLFCGAGSLSAGASDALVDLGYRPEFVAVNHWPVAVETYAKNHPGARVHCVTLDAAFPAQLVPEGRLDLLMAGIECTYFSRARGGKPVNDQQRMSAWHVVRWCTELRVKRLLLENVPEFVRWGPVNARTGKPVKSREGEYFNAWIAALRSIGFRRIEWRVLNCADFGDATTRERLFIMAWQENRPLPWPQPSHARRADLFGATPWRPARDVIDWGILGRSIFDRKRPLAPKTLARIAAGLVKFRWPQPFLVVLRQHCKARGIDLPLPTITAGGTHVGLVQPFVMGNRENNTGKGMDEPIPTATTAHGGGIAVVSPFVLATGSSGAPREVGEPMPTITLGGAGHVDRPGCARPALIAPYYGSGSGETCRTVDDPLPTLTTANRGELAFITASFGERPTQAPRIHAIDSPMPTVCATGHTNLVTPGREYDILFRTLEPHELAAAMSISEPDRPYHFCGTKTDVVRQIGQAVPRRTGRALARALMAPAEATLQAAE